MVEEEYRSDEAALGGTWRMHFADDPEELFEYTDRAYEEYEDTLEQILKMSESQAKVSRAGAAGQRFRFHAPCMGTPAWAYCTGRTTFH
jgi:hypothetical protein